MRFAFEVLVSLQLANYSVGLFPEQPTILGAFRGTRPTYCNSSFTAASLSFEGKRMFQIEINWGLNSIAPIRRIH